MLSLCCRLISLRNALSTASRPRSTDLEPTLPYLAPSPFLDSFLCPSDDCCLGGGVDCLALLLATEGLPGGIDRFIAADMAAPPLTSPLIPIFDAQID